jgi:hypothetical protein
MSIAWNTALQREFEFRDARTLATIRESETDGPSRRLITGREPHPTGSIVCVKALFRAVTWESMDSEMPLIPLAEVSSPVLRLKSQPHRLDMKVVGGTSPILSFFPDFEFVVDARLLEERTTAIWIGVAVLGTFGGLAETFAFRSRWSRRQLRQPLRYRSRRRVGLPDDGDGVGESFDGCPFRNREGRGARTSAPPTRLGTRSARLRGDHEGRLG